jgi:SsrA-binding protein
VLRADGPLGSPAPPLTARWARPRRPLGSRALGSPAPPARLALASARRAPQPSAVAKAANKTANQAAEASKILARNRRARHEYHVDEVIEAGLVLAGSEVKSIRDGKVTLVDAFADIDKGEAWLHQMDVGVYAFAHQRNHDPRRRRKLLLHRREIDRLSGKIREKGFTLVPLSLYEKQGRVKAELALVHGKQQWDKREDSRKRESQREMDRAMSVRRR